MVTLEELRAALGGDIVRGKYGRQLLCPAPGHSPADRGMSVSPSSSNTDGFVLPQESFNGHSWQECRDYVRRRLGMSEWRPGRVERDTPEKIVARLNARARQHEEEQADRERRIANVTRIWGQTVEPAGTIVERYLSGRMLDLFPGVEMTIRFHPRGPWGKGERGPMMIAAMCDVLTGELTAVHRTLLTDKGEKVDRRMLGPASGTAIMLSPATTNLIVGEGIESAWSALQLGYGPGVWAMGSAPAMGRLPIIHTIQRLVLLEERDTASANAVSDCGHRWSKAGKAVSTLVPTTGKDLNDSLRGIE